MGFLAVRNRAVQFVVAAASLFTLGAPAGAFTISDLPPSASVRQPMVAVFQDSVDRPKVEQVWCRWGCGAGAFVGGLAAGALIGGALAAPRYYYGGPYYGAYYDGPGPYYGGPYPGCWRSVWTEYGWRRAWVC